MKMKLDELKSLVNDMFKNAETKEQIENSVKLNQKIDELEKEATNLENENKELVKDLKESLMHQSFKGDGKQEFTSQTFDGNKLLDDLIQENSVK